MSSGIHGHTQLKCERLTYIALGIGASSYFDELKNTCLCARRLTVHQERHVRTFLVWALAMTACVAHTFPNTHMDSRGQASTHFPRTSAENHWSGLLQGCVDGGKAQMYVSKSINQTQTQFVTVRVYGSQCDRCVAIKRGGGISSMETKLMVSISDVS
jgi:hypothetical protein